MTCQRCGRYHASLPRGSCKACLRRYRVAHRLQGQVEIHHLIPRSLKRHPSLAREHYDVEAGYNLLFAPTHTAHHSMSLRPSRPIHSGGHMGYNDFVRHGLDGCTSTDAFVAFLFVLHCGVRGRRPVPWR